MFWHMSANDPHLKDKVKELIGNSIFEKYIFCWSAEDEVKKYAYDNYRIIIVQFPEIINSLIGKVSKSRENNKWIYDQSYPNTMLLQMLYHFSKPQKENIRIDLEKLRGK